MQLPIIHTNGTSPEMLKEGYLAAYHAIKSSADALNAVEFNARDYYPAGPDAWRVAREERTAQLESLAKLAAEIMTLLEHIQETIDAKNRQRNPYSS